MRNEELLNKLLSIYLSETELEFPRIGAMKDDYFVSSICLRFDAYT